MEANQLFLRLNVRVDLFCVGVTSAGLVGYPAGKLKDFGLLVQPLAIPRAILYFAPGPQG
jgi:hypothetical protein